MREDYGKFPELMRLIRFLSTATLGVTYDEIMQYFEWQRKTTERNLKFVRNNYPDDFEEFSDAVNGRVKRFRLNIPEKFGTDKIEDADITALSAAITHIKNKELSESLRKLQFKLMQKLQQKTTIGEQNVLEGKMTAINSIAAPEPKLKENAELVRTLESAILNQYKIIIKYKDKKDKYTLCPLGILYGPINNYLIASGSMDKENYRAYNYILDKIEEIEVTKEKFTKHKFNLQTYVDKSFGAFHSTHGPYDVVWHVVPEAAAEAMRFIFHKSQKVKPNRDGSLTIKMKADGLSEMAAYIIKWRGQIIPVAPKELVDMYQNLITEAQDSLNKYKK